MSKTKEIIICVISVALLILAIATNVFATEAPPLGNLLQETNNPSNDFQQIPENNTAARSTNTNTNNKISTNVNANNNTNNNTNTTSGIPYTGVDYSVIVIIAVCGVSAIYAYKKIRDYNV